MIYSISDLHLGNSVNKPMDIFGKRWQGYFDKIVADWSRLSNDDIVLICGDISWAMTLDDAKKDFDAISALPGKKIILRGNHDYWWSSLAKVKKFLPDGVFALQNDCIRIGNCLFCGSRGWILDSDLEDDEKIYQRELLRLEMSLASMSKERQPGDIVVGMTHYPPFAVDLAETPVTKLFTKYGVDTVCYGHLHGDCYAKKKVFIGGTNYFLTSCDLVDFNLVAIK